MATALFLLAAHALLGGSLGLAATAAPPPPPLPLPSAPQLWYSQGEIMALVHFNMASFVEDGEKMTFTLLDNRLYYEQFDADTLERTAAGCVSGESLMPYQVLAEAYCRR